MNISEINEKIRSHNPFRANVDTASSIWGMSFPDVEQHNAKVFGIVRNGLQLLRDPMEHKVQSLAILGNVGRGKTQLFSRIKHRLFDTNQILLSYVDARNLKTDRSIYTWLRQSLIEDLARPRGESNVSQIEEISYFLFNKSIPDIFSSPSNLKEKFDKSRQTYETNGKRFIDTLLGRIIQKFPSFDEYVLRALLWSSSQEYGAIALKWLSGRSIDATTAARLKLTTNLPDSEDDYDKLANIREAESSHFLRSFIPAISQYKPLIIGFDELESTDFQAFDSMKTRSQSVAELIKDIYDSFEGLKKDSCNGTLLILSTIEQIWKREVSQVKSGTIDRVTTLSPQKQKPVFLELPSPETGVEMVRLWLQHRLYEKLQIEQPSPFHPFTEDEIREIASLEQPPRQLLNQCAELFDKKLGANDEDTFKEAITKAKQTKLDPAALSDSDYVGNILRFGFDLLNTLEEPIDTTTASGEQIRQLIIDDVTDEIAIVKPSAEPKGLQPDNYIEFKITGRHADGEFITAVGVNQTKSYPQIHAELRRLNAIERFGFKRSCFVRGAGLPLGGKVTNELRHQLEEQGGEVVRFTPEEIEPLWHLYQLKEQEEQGNLGFSEASLESLILKFENDTVCKNPILLEILSSAPTEPEPDESDEDCDDDDAADLIDVLTGVASDSSASNDDSNADDDGDDLDLFAAFKL